MKRRSIIMRKSMSKRRKTLMTKAGNEMIVMKSRMTQDEQQYERQVYIYRCKATAIDLALKCHPIYDLSNSQLHDFLLEDTNARPRSILRPLEIEASKYVRLSLQHGKIHQVDNILRLVQPHLNITNQDRHTVAPTDPLLAEFRLKNILNFGPFNLFCFISYRPIGYNEIPPMTDKINWLRDSTVIFKPNTNDKPIAPTPRLTCACSPVAISDKSSFARASVSRIIASNCRVVMGVESFVW